MIQHVTRVVAPSQLQECVDFYEMIGFESVPVPPGLTGSALWLERHGTQIHLMPADDAHPAPGHVGVVVASYDDTLARLRDEGYEVNPRPEHWGSPRCFVRDPAGNVVELMAWPPGASGPAVAQGGRPT
jgi:catechol 2,3-dioxygenase-like lactoylglutathione lyase family enzyme